MVTSTYETTGRRPASTGRALPERGPPPHHGRRLPAVREGQAPAGLAGRRGGGARAAGGPARPRPRVPPRCAGRRARGGRFALRAVVRGGRPAPDPRGEERGEPLEGEDRVQVGLGDLV